MIDDSSYSPQKQDDFRTHEQSWPTIIFDTVVVGLGADKLDYNHLKKRLRGGSSLRRTSGVRQAGRAN